MACGPAASALRFSIVTMEIWYCFLGRQPRADILNALNETGLLHRACETPPSNGPGIIFFDEITNQLAETVHAASGRGAERVIAIALSRSAMKPAGIW